MTSGPLGSSTSTTHYHYSPNGQLLAETDDSGNVIREYIVINGQPAVMVSSTNLVGQTTRQLSYLHNDHMGTTQVITDANQNVVWEAQYLPFGEVVLTTENITFPLRFPGQYYDQETGYYYNYFRDYDPTLGRYIQSDPIGLRAGLNTYAYVDNNPTLYTDLYGLDTTISVFGCAGLYCVSGNLTGAEHQFNPPTLGGGIVFCHVPPDECDTTPEERKGTRGSTIGRFGIGYTAYEDGLHCISVGPHVGIPGPVITGGDATIHN